MSLNSLPNEVLLNIYSYLSLKQRIGVQRVSRKWNNLTLSDINHILFCFKREDESTQTNAPNGNAVNVRSLTDVNNVLKKCTNLESVTFKSIDLGDICEVQLKETAVLIAGFKRLRIKNSNWISYSDEKVILLTENMKDIEELAMVNVRNNSDILESLNFILSRNIKLKVVTLVCDKVLFNYNLLRPLQLKELMIRAVACDAVTSDFFEALLSNSKNTLLKFDIFESPKFLVKDCCHYLSCFSKLKDFRATVDSRCLSLLHIEKLETVQLRVALFDPFDTTIVNDLLCLLRCNKDLKVLKLCWDAFSDDFVESLCIGCTQLRNVNFDRLEEQDILTVKTLQSLSKLPYLESLEILCTRITDSEMAEFVRSSRSLRVLNVCFYVDGDTKSGNETLNAFIERATSNPSQKYFVNIVGCEDYPTEAPTNLFWLSGWGKTDHRQVTPREEWTSLAVKSYLK